MSVRIPKPKPPERPEVSPLVVELPHVFEKKGWIRFEGQMPMAGGSPKFGQAPDTSMVQRLYIRRSAWVALGEPSGIKLTVEPL